MCLLFRLIPTYKPETRIIKFRFSNWLCVPNDIKTKRVDRLRKKKKEGKALSISMALLSPSFSSPSCRLFRSNNISSKYHGGESKELMMSPSRVSTRSEEGLSRRDLVLIGLSSPLSTLLPLSSSPLTHAAEEAVKMGAEEIKMGSMVDDINAYSYAYPLELPSENLVFKWVESRKPERYSSAAPLSPDARLRIVSERVDLVDNLVISISIGPPNSSFLTSKDKKTWTAKDVADSVLSDKSALRVTSSQRLEESSVLDAHSTDIDGEPYWYYEYLVRKSPTKIAEASKMYRHYISSTAERDGFLYTINASTLGKQWDMMGPVLQRAVESFRLLPPTDSYVPPFKDPWRFW